MELLAGAGLIVGILWFVARVYGSVPEGQRKELNASTVQASRAAGRSAVEQFKRIFLSLLLAGLATFVVMMIWLIAQRPWLNV